MKSKSLLRLLILLSLIISIFSCKKDADYLDKFTGSFTFTISIHETIWFENFDTTYTSTFNGQITRYDGKLKSTLNNTDNPKNTYRRLAFDFGEVITPEVLESGEFVNESYGGADYSLSGKFINPDEVQFNIFGQSAGFSISENVTGRRN